MQIQSGLILLWKAYKDLDHTAMTAVVLFWYNNCAETHFVVGVFFCLFCLPFHWPPLFTSTIPDSTGRLVCTCALIGASHKYKLVDNTVGVAHVRKSKA